MVRNVTDVTGVTQLKNQSVVDAGATELSACFHADVCATVHPGCSRWMMEISGVQDMDIIYTQFTERRLRE